jgi:hypothetical protein
LRPVGTKAAGFSQTGRQLSTRSRFPPSCKHVWAHHQQPCPCRRACVPSRKAIGLRIRRAPRPARASRVCHRFRRGIGSGPFQGPSARSVSADIRPSCFLERPGGAIRISRGNIRFMAFVLVFWTDWFLYGLFCVNFRVKTRSRSSI